MVRRKSMVAVLTTFSAKLKIEDEMQRIGTDWDDQCEGGCSVTLSQRHRLSVSRTLTARAVRAWYLW